MHQSNCLYFHRVSSAVVCIFLMKLLGWFCCKQYTLTHPNTHFAYSYCIYKLCLKLLWTCRKNWASVRFAMQPTTVCQISSSFFLVARTFHKWKIIWIMRVLRHLHIFRSVCVCESVLMMIQLGLIANLYASRRAAFPSRLGCPFFLLLLPPPWNVWLLVLFIFFDKVLPI